MIGGQARVAPVDVVRGLYQGLLGRDPDEEGLADQVQALGTGRDGGDLRSLVHAIRSSPEAAQRWLRSEVQGRGEALWASARAAGASPAAGAAERQVYVLHIMKTAGTALLNGLQAVAGDRLCLTQVFLDNVPFLPRVVLERAALVAGHLGYEVVGRLAPDVYTATVIREPVARVLSHYAHVCRDPARSHEAAGLTLEQFLFEPRWRPLAENFQARHLVHSAGLDGAWRDFSPADRLAALGPPFPAADPLPLQFVLDYGPLDLPGTELEKVALERLATIDLVGVTEELQGFFSALAGRWGVISPPPLGRENVGVGTLSRPDVPSRLVAAIEEANQVDRALYEAARERSPGSPSGKI
jgi:hypothetical protein